MKSYKVKLTKLQSNHNNLRTDSVEGFSLELPEVGKSFQLVGDPLTAGALFRGVFTTEIKNVERMGNEFVFHTMNSKYKLEVLGETEA